MTSVLDSRPIVVAIAGPNGAGKTTFYEAFLEPAALRFVNADDLARELNVDPYESAKLAEQLRRRLLEQGESFVFETVFSDPVGDKLSFLREAVTKGHTVVLVFIGLDRPEISDERVAMRVLQGGHDVPREKLFSRYPRTMANLRRAIRELPHVLVFDNSDLAHPFRWIAEFDHGKTVVVESRLPAWLHQR